MRFMKFLAGAGLAAMLAACGGGGGVGDSSGGGSGGGETAVPTLTLALVDNNGNATTSVSAAGLVYAKATVKSATGVAVSGTKVTFAANATLVTLSPAAESLTDASGVATVQLSAATLSAAGAGTITASATVVTTAVTASRDFQLSPANLTLTALDVGTGTLAAYGNRPISVVANINGVAASNTPVQVAFTASCGTVSPATATTNSSGKASTTYTADSANCAGTNVRIAASSVGVTSPLEGTIAVAAIQATNLQFISASPQLIYLLGSGAATQSLVTFKVVDSSGNPVQNQAIILSLLNPNLAAGLSLDALGNTAAVTKTSDASGQVTVAVFSGNVPTSVQVVAKLPDPSTIRTNSNILTVASGKAVQKAASIAAEKWSIEGLNVDGVESKISFFMADRQGNPVPDGTEVNFVAESGVMIPPRCIVAGGQSQCTSTFRSSGTRPPNGRVSILAYVPGEEDFVDANFNNQYDLKGENGSAENESFTDMGNAFRDDDEKGSFTTGEFSVPRQGNQICDRTGVSIIDPIELGRLGTCDGKWGANEVRRQFVIVTASATADVKLEKKLVAGVEKDVSTGAQLSLIVRDNNSSCKDEKDLFVNCNNSMPTGTEFSAVKQSGTDACTVVTTFPGLLANKVGPEKVIVDLKSCGEAGDPANINVIRFIVKSPLGIQTAFNIALKSLVP